MSSPQRDLYEFGAYRLDLTRRVFMRGDGAVPLAPKTFELLVLMVQSPGRAFSRQELMTALWPDTFVEEANLSFQISALRKALGNGDARWIETVPKRGSRVSADVKTIPAVQPSESANAVIRTRYSKGWLAAASALAVVAVTVSYLAMTRKTVQPTLAGATSPRSTAAVPLTAYEGAEWSPSLSPDGSQVAFVWTGPAAESNADIYVKLAGRGEPIRLTTAPQPDWSPAWSPDGQFIAFERPVTDTSADVFVIPALGGAERKVATISLRASGGSRGTPMSTRTNLTWTPDSRWIAYGGAPSDDETRGIWLVARDGGEKRRLTEAGVFNYGDWVPTFSWDGHYLAFIRERAVSSAAIYVLPMTSSFTPAGAPIRVTPEGGIRAVAWTPRGDGLVFSRGGHLGLGAIFRVAIPPTRTDAVTEPELLPFGEQAWGISTSATGRLVYSTVSSDGSLWKLDLAGHNNPGVATIVAPSTLREHTPDYSPDGKRLAFASTRSGVEELWVAAADGSNPVQVTFMGGPQCANPRWSPDGRIILFNSRKEGSADLYLLNPDTGELRRITDHPAEEAQPLWSRDGQAIYFSSNRSGRFEVWRMPVGGGEPVQVTRTGGVTGAARPDSRFLYYVKDERTPTSIWRVPIGGGEERQIVDGVSYSLNFVVVDRGIYYLAWRGTPRTIIQWPPDEPPAAQHERRGVSIDFFEFATGSRTTLFDIPQAEWSYGMAVSPDQRFLLYSTIDRSDINLMLVDKFR